MYALKCFSIVLTQIVVNQDSTSRQMSALRSEIQMLQQELMDYRMVMLCLYLELMDNLGFSR
jgi:hypothetical protein